MKTWLSKLKVLSILGAVVLSFSLFGVCFADQTDKATLGGQDSSNNYSWRVDVNDNLIPGTTSQNNIGSSTKQVNNLYVTNQPIIGGSILSAGLGNAGYVSLASSSATISPSYTYVLKVLDTDGNALFTAGNLVNGTPGQILTITAIGFSPGGANGTYTLTPITSLTLKSVVFTLKGDKATLIYMDNTNGWILQGSSGSGITINYKV